MAEQWTTTTPDPELFEAGKQHNPMSGSNPRGEVAGCPTGLAEDEQTNATQAPGGAGAPASGNPVQPRKDQTEDEIEREGNETAGAPI